MHGVTTVSLLYSPTVYGHIHVRAHKHPHPHPHTRVIMSSFFGRQASSSAAPAFYDNGRRNKHAMGEDSRDHMKSSASFGNIPIPSTVAECEEDVGDQGTTRTAAQRPKSMPMKRPARAPPALHRQASTKSDDMFGRLEKVAEQLVTIEDESLHICARASTIDSSNSGDLRTFIEVRIVKVSVLYCIKRSIDRSIDLMLLNLFVGHETISTECVNVFLNHQEGFRDKLRQLHGQTLKIRNTLDSLLVGGRSEAATLRILKKRLGKRCDWGTDEIEQSIRRINKVEQEQQQLEVDRKEAANELEKQKEREKEQERKKEKEREKLAEEEDQRQQRLQTHASEFEKERGNADVQAWDEIKAIERSRARSRRHSLHGTSNPLGIDFTTLSCYIASYNSSTGSVQNVEGVTELGVSARSTADELVTLKEATEQAIGASPGGCDAATICISTLASFKHIETLEDKLQRAGISRVIPRHTASMIALAYSTRQEVRYDSLVVVIIAPVHDSVELAVAELDNGIVEMLAMIAIPAPPGCRSLRDAADDKRSRIICGNVSQALDSMCSSSRCASKDRVGVCLMTQSCKENKFLMDMLSNWRQLRNRRIRGIMIGMDAAAHGAALFSACHAKKSSDRLGAMLLLDITVRKYGVTFAGTYFDDDQQHTRDSDDLYGHSQMDNNANQLWLVQKWTCLPALATRSVLCQTDEHGRVTLMPVCQLEGYDVVPLTDSRMPLQVRFLDIYAYFQGKKYRNEDFSHHIFLHTNLCSWRDSQCWTT